MQKRDRNTTHLLIFPLGVMRKMAVYIFDRTHGLLKIVKKRKYYYAYRLKAIFVNLNTKRERYVFESHPIERWPYKPYDDEDVAGTPEVFFEDVKKWHSHCILPEI